MSFLFRWYRSHRGTPVSSSIPIGTIRQILGAADRRMGLVIAGLLPLVTLVFVSPRDMAGWLLLYASLAVVISSRTLRGDRRLFWVVILALAAHHAVALIYAFRPGLLPSMIDADAFHKIAVRWAASGHFEWAIDFEFYASLLALAYRAGGFYRLGGASTLLGPELSVFAYALSCIVLVRLFDLLKVIRFRYILAGMFGLLPAGIVFTSVPIRESFELLLLMCVVYGGISYVSQGRIAALLLMVLTGLGLSVIHKGLVLIALPVMGLFIAYKLLLSGKHLCRNWKMAVGPVVLAAMIVATLAVAHYDLPGSGTIRAVLAGQVLEHIGASRELIDMDNPRSSFGVALDTGSTGALARTLIPTYLYYLFGPFPWQVEHARDLYAMLEALARTMLLAASLLVLWRGSRHARAVVGGMMALYVGMTVFWALGTTNYGQAIRHHVLTNWILVLIGGPVILEILKKMWSNLLYHRRSLWQSERP